MKKPSKTEAEEVASAIQRFKTMPGAKVREELARLGIDPQPTIDAVKAIVANATATLQERRAHHARRSHHRETQETLKPLARPSATARRRAVRPTAPEPRKTALRRGFLFVAESDAGRGIASLAWHSTHDAAELIRESLFCKGTIGGAFHDALAYLDAAAEELHPRFDDDFDAAWPFIESVVETGIEVARDARLWNDFAGWFAETTAASPPALQCMFIHALRQLFAHGHAARELATSAALETLRHDPSPEARMLLVRLAQRHEPFLAEAGSLLGFVDEHTREIASRIDAAKHDALENFPKLRIRRAEEGFFDAAPVAVLINALHADTLSRFLAMYALAEVYVCAATLIAQDPKQRQKEQHAVFASRIAHQLRAEPRARFLTIGSLELVRDKYPRFTALLLASLVEHVPDEARAALFACLAEGYERTFHGIAQERTPHFELNIEPPAFRSPEPHELDVFGLRGCESAVAEELRPHMRWMNLRLERWRRTG